ncbi:Glycosyltransferase 25 family member [Armadillidium nasatum]|uniref:Glycosyltransferase 25 family member n=1 Tax=Armadillidium nasatum TaxID=96803 RepID=A0A5N5SW02_9CRUS|nr:Glycosyltransferase 25 family member [Armadillidium nasatum]
MKIFLSSSSRFLADGNLMLKIKYLLLFLLINIYYINCEIEGDELVLVVLLARNKHHLLPYFFPFFENLDYPKKNLALFIRSDHNKDETILGLESWLLENEDKYHSINERMKSIPTFYEESMLQDILWDSERMDNVIHFKEEALEEAILINANFIWFVDIDTFYTNPNVLRHIIRQNKTVIAPLLTSTRLYSTFWGEMDSDYFYKRSEDYIDIVTRKKRGVFSVPLVCGSVLINLNHPESRKLSAKENKIKQYLTNKHEYGNVLLLSESELDIKFDIDQLEELNLIGSKIHKRSLDETNINLNPHNIDKIYCMNLLRRPYRREKMQKKFKSLNLNGTFVDAVDWKHLNETYLKSLDLRVLKNYDKGDITYGAIGNFLSHYFIWKDIVEHEYEKVMILEDDAHFNDDFLEKLEELESELELLDIDWELIYLGRRAMEEEKETKVPNSKLLINPAFTWWTVGYLLSYEGAKKLVDQEPLQKFIPTDEYLPIMFDQHPELLVQV